MRKFLIVMVFFICPHLAVGRAHHEHYEWHQHDASCLNTQAPPEWDSRFLPLPAEIHPTTVSPSETSVHATTDTMGRVHVAVASTTSYGNTSHQEGGLYVLTSKDGSNWSRVATVFPNNPGATVRCVYMTSNPYRCSHYRNHLYLVACMDVKPDYGPPFSQVIYWRSVDSGNTFLEQFRIDKHKVGPDAAGNLVLTSGGRAATPAVSVNDDSNVTVSWTDGAETFSRTSHDGDPAFTGQEPVDEENPNNAPSPDTQEPSNEESREGKSSPESPRE